MAAPDTAPLGLEDAIGAMTTAAGHYADARALEQSLEDRRPIVKHEAIGRLMAARGLSATAAEKIVELDETYAELRVQQGAAVVSTILARAEYEASRARLWFAVRPPEGDL